LAAAIKREIAKGFLKIEYYTAALRSKEDLARQRAGNLRSLTALTSKESRFEMLDWEGLREAGDFDTTYLHLRKLSSQHLLDNE
jgi:hypothetical protein